MRRYSQFLHFQPGIVQGIFSHRFCRGVLDQLSNHWNEKLSAYTRVGWYIASYHTEKLINKNITIQVLQRRLDEWVLTNCPKVEKVLEGSLDLIPSPLSSVKIQIMGGKVCLMCKGKTLLGIVNKLLKTKSLLTSPSNAFYPSKLSRL